MLRWLGNVADCLKVRLHNQSSGKQKTDLIIAFLAIIVLKSSHQTFSARGHGWLGMRLGIPETRSQALSSKTGGWRESLVTSVGKVVDFWHLALAVPIRLQNKTTCTRDILSTQQKIVNLKLISTDCTSKVDENSFQMCGRGASPESSRSKFTVAGLQDRLAHHTLQLRVYMYNRTADALRMKREIK